MGDAERRERFEYIFNRMNGYIAKEESCSIPAEFEDERDELYDIIFSARIRISKALDNNAYGENADAMFIVRAYEAITRMLCQRMYEYGYRDGRTL